MSNIKSNSEILEELSLLKTLTPWDITNSVFSSLYHYVIKNDYEPTKDDNLLKINQICSNAEFELEKHWSKRIVNSSDPYSELKKFPYYQNYLKLVQLEFSSARNFKENIENVLFIGSWPLPLTAIFLSLKYSLNCKIVDKSEIACSLSQRLIRSLNLQDRIILENADILDYQDDDSYDLSYLASLLCLNSQEEVIKSCMNLNFSNLLIRTSRSSREILYKSLDSSLVEKYLKKQLTVHPHNEIVNSFIIYKK